MVEPITLGLLAVGAYLFFKNNNTISSPIISSPTILTNPIEIIRQIIPNIQSTPNIQRSPFTEPICGFRGTNGVWYNDVCQAWRNGAVSGFDPKNPQESKPEGC